jgi:hypothetical protein
MKLNADVTEYLRQCAANCTSRLAEPCFFGRDTLQQNTLRVESLRDMSPRCGEKMPEHWHEDVKRRGWGIWVFSGGSVSVFGHCTLDDCPRKNEFLRTAPNKKIRALANVSE